jgi:erythronate-4-phosphate dehydrogenase
MKIYYEDSMPYAAEFFSDLGESVKFSHKTITPEMIADADVLLTRSTTKVTPSLLAKANKLKFVGTATAGTDHVDKDFLQTKGIPFVSAGGCNAVAVAEYVLSTLFVMAAKYDWQVPGKTVGIVGAGHVGTALTKHLSALGIDYKLCDPPLQDAGDPRSFVNMEEIMQCDVITLHVPWIKDGLYPTENMFNADRLSQLSDEQILINACRGEVLDNHGALDLFEQGRKFRLVLDVWDNEPDINFDLIPHTSLATAHIAGHTIEGKARGTEMLYTALCELLEVSPVKILSDYLPVAKPSSIEMQNNQDYWYGMSDLILDVYNISDDDSQFKDNVDSGEKFRYIRKHYPIRREFSAIKVNTGNFVHSKAIYDLGFLC